MDKPPDGAPVVEVPAAGPERRSAALTEPTLPFIVVAGLVHIARGYAADILLFFGMAGLLVWDAGRSPALGLVPRPPAARVRVRAGMALSALGFGAVVSWVPRSAGALHVAFAVPGLVVLWALLWRPAPVGSADAETGVDVAGLTAAPPGAGTARATESHAVGTAVDRGDSAQLAPPRAEAAGTQDSPTGRGWLVWPAVGLLLAFIELVSFLSQPDARTDNPSHPTVSTVVEPWLSNQAARALTLAVWLAMGWWLFRRLSTWAARQ